MELGDWFAVLMCVILFGLGFLLGDNDGMRRNYKSVVLVSGEKWDYCDQPSVVIHADGNGTKMANCYKKVKVDFKAIK